MVCLFHCTATTEIYTDLHTLSLHDALPISVPKGKPGRPQGGASCQSVYDAEDKLVAEPERRQQHAGRADGFNDHIDLVHRHPLHVDARTLCSVSLRHCLHLTAILPQRQLRTSPYAFHMKQHYI